jgi:hypothetical protein
LDFGARKSGLKCEDPAGGRILILIFLLSLLYRGCQESGCGLECGVRLLCTPVPTIPAPALVVVGVTWRPS